MHLTHHSTGKRPYGCGVPGCPRAFARRNTFLKHYKRHHPGVPVPPSASVTTPRTQGSRHTSSRKREAGAPYPARINTGKDVLTPGPPGPNGQPQWYIRTPSTADASGNTDTNESGGTPHGFTALGHPSQGAVYPYGGHGGRIGHVVGRHGRGGGGLRGTRTANRGTLQRTASAPIASPATAGPGSGSIAHGLPALQTPVSASGHSSISREDTSSDLLSPVSTLHGYSGSAKFDEGGFSGQQQEVKFPVGSSDGSHLNVGHAQYGHQFQTGQQAQNGMMFYNGVPHHPAWGARSASHGVVNIKTDSVNGLSRNVSEPTPRSQIMVPGQGVAGFHPSQLAMPHQQSQTHLQPAMSAYALGGHSPLPHSHMSTVHSAPTSAVDVQTGSREESPEPLIDVHSVPTISYHVPADSTTLPFPLQGSYTAVPNNQMQFGTPNPLTQAPPQFAVMPAHHQISRLQSAPPHLQRFNSAPDLSHIQSSWNQTDISHAGHYDVVPDQNHSSEGDEEDWEDLEEQMLSREASDGLAEETQVVEETQTAPALNVASPANQWGPPITYPVNPRAQLNSYPSSTSTSSTASTLVNSTSASGSSLHYPMPVPLPLPQPMPMSMPAPQSATDSGHFPPYVAQTPQQVYVGAMTPMYPSPMTPWTAQSQSFSQYDQNQYMKPMLGPPYQHVPSQMKPRFPQHGQHALGSPAMINPPHMPHARPYALDSPYAPVHNITLTTPPKGYRKDSGGVASVGLGIANVHFEDRSGAITTPHYPHQSDVDMHQGEQGATEGIKEEPEGTDELDEEESLADAGEDSDSDDDFVLGRKKKAAKKGKKAKKGWTKKPRRKSIR